MLRLFVVLMLFSISISISDVIGTLSQRKFLTSRQFVARQVPGDGSCLFHSLSAALTYELTGTNQKFNDSMLLLSDRIRQSAVSVLSTNVSLYVESGETITTSELLKAAALSCNKTCEEYLSSMTINSTWGGGPELVAISNFIQRPIFLYQIGTPNWLAGGKRSLKLISRLGYPKFKKGKQIHILYTNGK